MPIFALVIPVSLILIFYLLITRMGCSRGNWREAILMAFVIWAVLIVAATEILSLGGWLTFPFILAFWVFVILLIGFILKVMPQKTSVRLTDIRLSLGEVILLMVLILFLAITGIIALNAPPNNFDSMTYHMSRVAHWVQNESVASYPSHILRQLLFPPWAEFAILHLQILSSSDRFANLVQWFSMAGSLVGISLIAQLLGANRRVQLMAAVLGVSIPMGILQSSSTQNDYVAGFWLVCFVYFLLRLKENHCRFYAIAAGMSLGVALLSKATAYLYAFPFGVWFFISQLRSLKLTAWKYILIIVMMALVINLGFYARNIEFCGVPIAEVEDTTTTGMNAALFLSNVVKNVTIHSMTIYKPWNDWMEVNVIGLHAFMGVDILDPRTTYSTSQFLFSSPEGPFHEDFAPNGLHTVLIIVCLLILVFSGKYSKLDLLKGYCICLVAGFLLFCYYIKWNNWVVRLHLPLFLLWAPAIAVILSRWQKLLVVIVCVLTVAAFPWLTGNITRKLVGNNNIFRTSRLDQYFAATPGFKEPFFVISRSIKDHNCSQIGFISTENSWEYPLWVLLNDKNDNPVRIEHIRLNNTMIAGTGDFKPCAVVVVDSPEDILAMGKDHFQKDKDFMFIKLFIKQK